MSHETSPPSPLPEPLVPADADLRDFPYVELDVRRLRDSRFAASSTPEAFRAGVLLWCAAWHQVPAGSLPDDDVELAQLAGYGRFIDAWRADREAALHGFISCSDGRMYHTVLCEKVREAWGKRLQHHYVRAVDRVRKRKGPDGQPLQHPMSFDEWNTRRIASGVPMEKADAGPGSCATSAGNSELSAGTHSGSGSPSNGIPPENPLRGRGKQRGRGEGEGINTAQPLSRPQEGAEGTSRFAEFWDVWPTSERKAAKAKCLEHWRSKKLDAKAAQILAHVSAMKASDQWSRDRGQYVPAPLTYLRGERWDGAEAAQLSRVPNALSERDPRQNRQEAIEDRNRAAVDRWLGETAA